MVEIRPASAEDVQPLAALQRRAALEGYAEIFPPGAPQPSVEVLRVLWDRAIASPDHDTAVWAAVADDASVVGGVVLADEDGECRLSRLYVEPDRWGRGVGGRLLDTAVEAALERRSPGVLLWVLESNVRARSWYERRRWQTTGRRQIVVEGSVDEVEYRLALPGIR